MNSVEKVHELCCLVLTLTEEDFSEVEKMAREQTDYVNPLKLERQTKFNDMGDHNMNVLAALKNLKQVLVNGAPTP